MKKFMLVLMLILCVAALSACQSSEPQRFTVITQTQNPQNLYGNVATPTPAPAQEEPGFNFDEGGYDPLLEEGLGGNFGFMPQDDPEPVNTPVPTIRSDYAGATPVVIDPIDKPTPTPLPPLTFSYQVYDAVRLHLSFEGPVGWVVNDTAFDSFVLTNPASGADYTAELTVRAVPVNSQYDKNDLKKEVKGMLDTIGAEGFNTFSPSSTAERTLMDKAGIYANYTGTTTDGVEVAGRVHATCINKVLYTVHITYPRGYRDTYIDTVYAQLRKTMTITQ
ncbi:MAG: hypothetical protein IKK21_07845 [Clostridia bacterium]|nr:hypothetical protein [Clostridia bacterium]